MWDDSVFRSIFMFATGKQSLQSIFLNLQKSTSQFSGLQAICTNETTKRKLHFPANHATQQTPFLLLQQTCTPATYTETASTDWCRWRSAAEPSSSSRPPRPPRRASSASSPPSRAPLWSPAPPEWAPRPRPRRPAPRPRTGWPWTGRSGWPPFRPSWAPPGPRTSRLKAPAAVQRRTIAAITGVTRVADGWTTAVTRAVMFRRRTRRRRSVVIAPLRVRLAATWWRRRPWRRVGAAGADCAGPCLASRGEWTSFAGNVFVACDTGVATWSLLIGKIRNWWVVEFYRCVCVESERRGFLRYGAAPALPTVISAVVCVAHSLHFVRVISTTQIKNLCNRCYTCVILNVRY